MAVLLPKFLRHVLEHLIFKKPSDQFISGIPFFTVFILVSRKKHAALDIEERSCHDQKLTGDVHVVVFHLPYIFQILIRDRYDRNIIDVDFILFNEVHQKIHGTFEHLKL